MFFKKKKEEPENIEEVIFSFKQLENKVKELETEIEELREKSKLAVQGIGIIRFNPFSEVGSNQSFSLALIDGRKNGVVITGYYSREGSNVYGKEIKNGISEYTLSEEEKKAIEIAFGDGSKKDKL